MNRSIDIKFLKTFACVADKGSYSDAAASLFMTQPAVSQHVRKVEEHFGKRLLEKSSGLKLTREGQLVFHYSQRAIRLQDEMMSEFAKLDQQQFLKISISDGIRNDLVSAIAQVISESASLNLSISRFSVMTPAIIDESDLTLGFAWPEEKSLARDILVEHPMSLVCPQGETAVSKVVFSTMLEQSLARRIIEESGLESDEESQWLQSESASLLGDAPQAPGQAVVLPSWSLPQEVEQRALEAYPLGFFLRASNQFRKHFDMYALTDRIRDLVTPAP
ncbi:LysR family transcriptional regulator [Ferrimonas sp. YFM]|uniref:LysR family transcriptional regulator n=1 Tax=Ferrimonas sp. YFM TaxID=3028878 RepID=UPI0025740E2E|nr:LysR family transcriptional regulator [Ferrimonas sp. YFM]BDY04288.1 LysR family transcriptional regulator [Ferrimonas sp. YFM]